MTNKQTKMKIKSKIKNIIKLISECNKKLEFRIGIEFCKVNIRNSKQNNSSIH